MPDTGTLYWLPRYLSCTQLDATDTLLLVTLADHVDADDRTFVGIERLAAGGRCSYATAKRRLADLQERGYIERERRRRDDGNLSTYSTRLLRGAPGLTVSPSAQPVENPAPGRTQVSPDQGSPRRAVTRAHPGEPAEVPRGEPHSVEPPSFTLAPADADAQQQLQDQLVAIEQLPAPDLVPIRAEPGRTLTSQLVRYGLAQGDLADAELQRARDRVDVHRLALRLAEQHTEGTQRTRVATQLAAEYLGAALGAEPDALAEVVTPATRRLLGRLCATTTPGSVLRYLDLAVQAGAGLRDQDADEGLAIAKYASAVHRRERAEGSNPLLARRAANS